MTVPVLFLIFNRPDLAARVFERIRQARPPQLFIAADGPRADRPGEAELCSEGRRIVEQVDWPCEVKTLFRDQNLGCRKAVSEAITWFFQNVEEGIILEDDCVPDLSFFDYCEELLERYRRDIRVMVISGDNHQMAISRTKDSYYFSKYPHCWGWASWRRAWFLYDDEMSTWTEYRVSKAFRLLFNSARERIFWTSLFEQVQSRSMDTWDIAWVYTCWMQHGVSILPSINLVHNVGFGDRATHTFGESPECVVRAGSMAFPLKHPRNVKVNRAADRYTDSLLFSGTTDGILVRLRKLIWAARRARNAHLLMLEQHYDQKT